MSVEAWLENSDRRKMIFPPQSRGVNLIENIWSWMTKDVGEVTSTTCEEIKRSLFRSSDRIRLAKIKALYSSLLWRTATIIRSRGYPTKY